MIMRKNLRVLFCSMMVAVAIGFTSCEGDQGEIGPKGDPGDEEAASFGNIEVTISGVDANDEEYTAVLDFKYLPDNYPSSTWHPADGGGRYFSVSREFRIDATSFGRVNARGSTADLYLYEKDGKLELREGWLSARFVVRNAFIDFSTYVDGAGDQIDNLVFSNYSFDEKTGALKFNFTYTEGDESSDSVRIDGKVDVKVYKSNND